MTDALVSIVLEQLTSTIRQQVEEEVKLVVGVDKEVAKLTSNLKAIQAVLYDAEKKQVNDATVRDWLEKLRDVTYDIDDTVDEWSTAIDLKCQIEGVENASIPKKKVCFSPCFCFRQVSQRRDIALRIKDLNERLDVIAKEKETYHFSLKIGTEEPKRLKTTSFVDVSEVRGRDEDKKTIVKQLLNEGSEQKGSLHTISIVGSGGIGKTTLAQLAYNHNEVMVHFSKRIWVCVSDPFDEIRVAKAILEELGVHRQELAELQTLLRHIQDSIKEQKFLLVLDDVWTEDRKKWESLELSLKSGATGSKILVTTRNERVAKMMHTTYTNHLEQLSEDDCWSLFSHIAFFERKMRGEDCEKFEEIGRELADKCKGLPLAAKALGSLMSVKESIEEWRNVLESEIWSQKVVGEELSPVLLLSYYDLPPAIKRCFSYCAVFPKDTEIERDDLIQLWMAQGYLGSNKNAEMEITGKEYFMNLAMRSFFQEFRKDYDGSIRWCKMHDIVHDLAQFLTKNECSIMEVGGVNARGMESSCTNVRHSTLTIEAEVSSPISICNARNLRTLLIHKHSWFASIHGITDLISHLTCVRALNLSRCSVKEVPMEIGKLIHLRYLNLSYNGELERLPETVCDLHNLQTLNLEECESLEKLPQGMGKLINLRHLVVENSRMKEIPKGIGRLSCLRTLRWFIVSGGKDCSKLGDLEKLNHLRSLCIGGLKNVGDGREAEKANLKNKKHLQKLVLNFSQNLEDNRASEEGRMMDNDVLEALQPPPDLELLGIANFLAPTVSSSFILMLTKLRKLVLYQWPKCECLPPLGKLPFLESLEISEMSVVKTVGVEFLGISLDDSDTPIVAFPKLKHLSLDWMPEWEEWDVPAGASRRVTLMPLLLSLRIYNCDNLKALPNHISQMTNLEHLIIGGCRILRQRCERETGEDWHKISHIPSIQFEESEEDEEVEESEEFEE